MRGPMMNFVCLSLLILVSSVHCLKQELCRYNLYEIETALNSSGNVRNFIVDCLALNGTQEETFVRYISLSVVSDDIADSMRYDFQCVGGGVLIPTLSDSVSNTSTPGINPACASCNFTADDPCVGRCGESCGACRADSTSDCLTCRYLRGHDGVCLNSSSCGKLNFIATETSCACDGFLRLYEGSTEYLLPGRQYPYECVRECERFDRQIEEDGVQICEVCGVENCVKCGDEQNECMECIHGYEVTEETEGKCESEEEINEKELRELTEELLHEQEVEEEEREDTELHLQILLPIFCILTAAVLIALSVIAHFWYPYIDKEGNKRSKTKPEDDEQPTVWRPRPTIRFR